MERAVGHNPVERREDLGVVQVDLRLVQARLGHAQARTGLGGIGLRLIDGGLGGQRASRGRVSTSKTPVRSAATTVSTSRCCSSTMQLGGRVRRGQAADPLVLLLGELPAGDQPVDVGFGHPDCGRGGVPLAPRPS